MSFPIHPSKIIFGTLLAQRGSRVIVHPLCQKVFNHLNVIPSFKCHSIFWSFLLSSQTHLVWEKKFLLEWYWNDQMMAEWQVSQNSVFIFPSKTPPFLLIPPFLGHLRMSRMTRNENHTGKISFKTHSSHFHFIPSSFIIQEWWGMTKWGEMKGYSWSKAKHLILKFLSSQNHSLMPSQYPLQHIVISSLLAHSSNISSFGCHSIIPSSFRLYIIIPISFRHPFIISILFHHLNVIPSFECHSIIWMSFHHLNVILSFTGIFGTLLAQRGGSRVIVSLCAK